MLSNADFISYSSKGNKFAVDEYYVNACHLSRPYEVYNRKNACLADLFGNIA
jgi:hypothetical protein